MGLLLIIAILVLFISYAVARFVGKYAYDHSGKFLKSYILSVSIFLIIYYVLFLFVFSGFFGFLLSLLGLNLSNFLVQWAIEGSFALLLFVGMRSFPQPVLNATGIEVAEPKILKATAFFAILGLIVLAIPVYNSYRIRQAIIRVDQQSERALIQVNNNIQNKLTEVRDSLEHYYVDSGKYPATISELVPNYFAAELFPNYVSVSRFYPLDIEYIYQINENGNDYRLCVYFRKIKDGSNRQCFTSKGIENIES